VSDFFTQDDGVFFAVNERRAFSTMHALSLFGESRACAGRNTAVSRHYPGAVRSIGAGLQCFGFVDAAWAAIVTSILLLSLPEGRADFVDERCRFRCSAILEIAA
jgi:hypothetical protein